MLLNSCQCLYRLALFSSYIAQFSAARHLTFSLSLCLRYEKKGGEGLARHYAEVGAKLKYMKS